MQSFSCTTLNAATDESVEYGTVTDSRDNNEYTIARLKDGKCWMTENLRIVGRTISSADSDMASGSFTIPTSNISKFNVGSNGYSTTTGKNNDAAYVETVSYDDPTYGAKSFESGYYTWHTATAGTGTANQTTQGWNAPSSICPKGWKLPTGGSGGDFQTLTNAYSISNSAAGSNTLRGGPLNFTYAGYVNYSNGSMYYQGSYGSYWSSTVYDQYYAYYLSFGSSSVNPTSYRDRPYGLSVRCVAKFESGCFTADTLVDTPNGLIPIKDISIGTQVYSYDFDSNQIKTTTVVDKYTPNRNDVVKLTLDNGIVIQGTYPHLVYDYDLNDWKKIGEFKPGDEILTIDGTKAKVVSNDKVEGSYDVYDFEVNELHNYFIVSPNNKEGGRLLVHNYSSATDTVI